MIKYETKTSLIYWYPKIKDLDIPMPKTSILPITKTVALNALDGDFPLQFKMLMMSIANRHGYPLFVKTDLAAGKHGWTKTCFIEKEADLFRNIKQIIESNEMADIIGLPYTALIFRDYIELDSKFTAFWGHMPVARERRYFIREGEVLCHHPYWILEAFEDISNIDNPDWKQLLAELNTESTDEIALLTQYSSKVAQVLPGYWSIDYAHGKNGIWYLIDMALGVKSWHMKGCKYKLSDEDYGA